MFNSSMSTGFGGGTVTLSMRCISQNGLSRLSRQDEIANSDLFWFVHKSRILLCIVANIFCHLIRNKHIDGQELNVLFSALGYLQESLPKSKALT